MADNFDVFADVINSNNGIFATEQAGLEPALTNFDSTTTVPAADGVHITMYCRGCGRSVDCTLGYHELVAIKYRCPPQAAYQGTPAAVTTEYAWSAPHGAFYPRATCSSCQHFVAPLVTPEEAEKHLQAARANGWIRPEFEAQLARLASERAAPYRAQLVHAPTHRR